MSEIIISTEADFTEVLKKDNLLTLFTAPAWCIPCRRFEPHWNKAIESDELAGINFAKVDMGKSPQDTGEHWATAKFSILGVPSVKFWYHSSLDPVDISSRAVIPFIREVNSVRR